jgi:hypothetical protein
MRRTPENNPELYTDDPHGERMKGTIDAVGRLLDRQTLDGAFGLWHAGDHEATPWLGAYVTDFLTRAMPKADEPHGVMFMLDEFPSLGEMPQFQIGIAYFRGYRVKLFLIVQDTQQLKGIYEEAGMNAFLSNSYYRITFAANTGHLLTYPMVGYPTKATWSMWMALGVPLGAFVSAKRAGEFGWKVPPGDSLVKIFGGGLLMGGAALIAEGCNINQGLTNSATLALGSLLTFAAMGAGAWLTLWALYMRR